MRSFFILLLAVVSLTTLATARPDQGDTEDIDWDLETTTVADPVETTTFSVETTTLPDNTTTTVIIVRNKRFFKKIWKAIKHVAKKVGDGAKKVWGVAKDVWDKLPKPVQDAIKSGSKWLCLRSCERVPLAGLLMKVCTSACNKIK